MSIGISIRRFRIRGRIYASLRLMPSMAMTNHLRTRYCADDKLLLELRELIKSTMEGAWNVSTTNAGEERLYLAVYKFAYGLDENIKMDALKGCIASTRYGNVDARAIEIIGTALREGAACRLFAKCSEGLLGAQLKSTKDGRTYSLRSLLWCAEFDTDTLASQFYAAEASLRSCQIFAASDKETRQAMRLAKDGYSKTGSLRDLAECY